MDEKEESEKQLLLAFDETHEQLENEIYNEQR